MRHRIAATLAVAAALVAPRWAGAALPAEHDVVPLPTTSFRDIEVDAAHGRVFVTDGGPTGILVRDLDGGAAGVIPNQPGAQQMRLSADGATLYVALRGADAISLIDTATLVERARYSTGVDTCPVSVAPLGDRIWFGYGCGGWDGRVGVVDLSGELPVVTRNHGASFYTAPRVHAAPGDPAHLVVAGFGSSPATLYSYPVSGSTLGTPATVQVGSLADFALTGDGGHVVTASGGEYRHQKFRTADLVKVAEYGDVDHPYPNAVATYGDHIAAGTWSPYDKDVRTFLPDGTKVRGYDVGDHLESSGLAFAGDGLTLYAVSGAHSEGNRRLHVFRNPLRFATTMVLTPQEYEAQVGEPFVVRGALTSATPVPAGAAVHVTRSSRYGTVALPDAHVDAAGNFSVSDTVDKRGDYQYLARYDGDAAHAPAEAQAAKDVVGFIAALTLATDRPAYSSGQTATVTVTLGQTDTNRNVRIVAAPYGQDEVELYSGPVDGNGRRTAYFGISRRTTFRVEFAGDDRWEPRTVTRTVLSKALVTQGLAGYYDTYGGYRRYHVTDDPRLAIRVTPNRAGSCATGTVQAYHNGAWRNAATSGCARLDAQSRVVFRLDGTHVRGQKYRTRGTFEGDFSNTRTVASGWLYFTFTS